MPHLILIVFLFLLGACIGSFLNVVVWRLPRGESLMTPPSHCPVCEKHLPFYDNVPILGWIKLGGKCRFCRTRISPRYPIVETVTALLFVLYYVMFYVVQVGPCPPVRQALFAGAHPIYTYTPPDFPTLGLYLFLVSALLAASLIDAELFIIPASIPWLVAAAGILFHAVLDQPHLSGALNALTSSGAASPTAALGAGGTVGLLLSLGLWFAGVMPTSFPNGEPELEVDRDLAEAREEEERQQAGRKKGGKKHEPEEEKLPPPPVYTPGEIRREMRKEMLFLLPPMAGAILWYWLTTHVPGLRAWWGPAVVRHDWLSGLLGSLFGGLVGGFTVWLTRILGTLGFGRVAMGLGDVDLMFAVGTVLGAGPAVVAFFLAPVFGIAVALYGIITRSRRELPFGPYLSLASGFVVIFYCRIYDTWLADGLEGLSIWLHGS